MSRARLRSVPGPAERSRPFRKRQVTSEEKKEASMRKLFLASIGVVVLLAGAGAAFQWWTYGRFIEGTDNAYLQADAVAVAARIEGYIRELKVEENARVEQGDVLA